MPKKVFNSLEPNKKAALVNAAYNVFSKHPYHLVSINEITKELGITRTAFYYYFYNKEDLYGYLITKEKEEFINNYIYSSKKKISLEEIFELLFIYLSKYKGTNKQNFYIDLFYNISFDRQNVLIEKLSRSNNSTYGHFIGFEYYKVDSKEEEKEISLILFEMVFHEILHYYESTISYEEALIKLNKKIDLIKHGIVKKEYKYE